MALRVRYVSNKDASDGTANLVLKSDEAGNPLVGVGLGGEVELEDESLLAPFKARYNFEVVGDAEKKEAAEAAPEADVPASELPPEAKPSGDAGGRAPAGGDVPTR